jgi:hypothetical protein
MSLEDAQARAVELERPLLMVLVDGGEDSRRMERGPLQSSRVSAWIKGHAVPVRLDVSRAASGDMEAGLLVSRLRVDAFPALILMRGGQELGRTSGFVRRGELAKWLESTGGK